MMSMIYDDLHKKVFFIHKKVGADAKESFL